MTPARLRTIAARWSSDDTMTRLVEPTLADFAFETDQARNATVLSRARVWVAGQWAFWKVFSRIAAAEATRSARAADAWREIGRLASVTAVVVIALGAGLATLAYFRWTQLFGVPPSLRFTIELAFRTVPLALPVALAAVILWRRAQQSSRVGTIVVVSIAGSLLSLALVGGSIREMSPVTAGLPQRLLQLVHEMRWAIGVGPGVLGLFALAISIGVDRRSVVRRLAGTIAAIGYPLALAVAMQLGTKGRVPILAAAWGPDAAFVALAVVAMLLSRRRRRVVAALFAVIIAAAGVRVAAQSPQTPSVPVVQTAWRNVQVLTELKAAPALALYDTMDFVAGSLGVSCEYCHSGPFDLDTKPTKVTARRMMQMVRTINDGNFNGKPVITCQTCHQGHIRPNGVPAPWSKSADDIAAYNRLLASSAPVAPPSARALPSAEQVLMAYRNAIGGVGLRSVRMVGTQTPAVRQAASIEITALMPDRVRTAITINGAVTQQIINGDHGWLVSATQRLPMSLPDLERLREDMRVRLALPESVVLPAPLSVTGTEHVGAQDCYVLQATTAAGLERFYFEIGSGLLVKFRRELPTLLGTSVREMEWRDYRAVGGYQRPFTMIDHSMANQAVYTFTSIETNVPVDDAIFEPPPPKERPSVTLPAARLDAVAGRYQLVPGNVVTIAHEGAALVLTQANGSKFDVLASSDSEFFLKGLDVTLKFVSDETGAVTSMTVTQGGITRECPRVK